jgi:hypothetical protein
VIKTVTVLGTGTMGAGMARDLASAGPDVTVWNRSPGKARALSGAGAHVEEDVRSAVAGADVVLTMLFHADAVADVAEEALPAGPDGDGVGAEQRRRARRDRAADPDRAAARFHLRGRPRARHPPAGRATRRSSPTRCAPRAPTTP